MTTAQINPLATEIELYEQLKSELVAGGNTGKFALIGENHLIGLWDTYVDALQAGYQKFGLEHRFLVKKIEGLEGVQFFTRDIQCPVSPTS